MCNLYNLVVTSYALNSCQIIKMLIVLLVISLSGNTMEGTLILQYKLFIYTSVNATETISLNETITSVVTQTIEEKLEASLETISITSMLAMFGLLKIIDITHNDIIVI